MRLFNLLSTSSVLSLRGFRQLATVLCAWLVAGAVHASVLCATKCDQVFRPVVVSDAVDVVAVFVGCQESAQLRLEHDAVLGHIASGDLASQRVRVIWPVYVDVPVHHAPTNKQVMVWPALLADSAAVSRDIWPWQSGEPAEGRQGSRRKRRDVAASAVAQPALDVCADRRDASTHHVNRNGEI